MSLPHYGPPAARGVSYRDRRGVYAVLIVHGDVLLVEHDGELLLPGGGIDPGESPLQALHREIHEETGWRVAIDRRLGTFQRHDWLAEEAYHARKIALIYRGRPIRQLGPALEADHHPVWVKMSEAQALLSVEGEAVMVERVLRQM